jgi:hypothetical protein
MFLGTLNWFFIFQFCKSDGASNGVRQFIDQDVVNFAKALFSLFSSTVFFSLDKVFL